MNRWVFGNNSLLIGGVVNLTGKDTLFGVVSFMERHPDDAGMEVPPRNKALISAMFDRSREGGMECVKLGFHSSSEVNSLIKALKKFAKGMKKAEDDLEDSKLTIPSLIRWREQVRGDESVKKGK